MIKVKLTGNWNRALATLQDVPGLKRAISTATAAEAEYLRKEIVKGIQSQDPGGKPFKPLDPLTLAKRRYKGFRGTKALIVTNTLMNSVRVKHLGRGTYFVGVPKGSRTADGADLVKVARINEEGGRIAIRVTERMRRFLMALIRDHYGRARDAKGRFTGARWKTTRSGSLSTGVLIVNIPPRPFIRPVVESVLSKPMLLKRRMTDRLSKLLRGKLGP